MTSPRIIAPHFESIPRALQLLPRWILWRLEEVEGRWTKVPYQLDGKKHASTSDPRTWSSFELVKKAYERGGFSGVGFCRAGSMVMIDVDGGVVITPSGELEFVNFPGWPAELQPGQLALAFRLNGNWMEISPSGTGFHVYGLTATKFPTIQLAVPGEAHMGLAIYTSNRFFAVTGLELGPEGDGPPTGDPLGGMESTVANFIESAGKVKAKPEAASGGHAVSSALSSGDEDVIRLVRKDRKASALWDGDWEGQGLDDSSHSGADFALCQRLAFYCGKDAAQIDRLFRQSALYREAKWDSARPGGSYGSLTIERAIAQTSDVYTKRPAARKPNVMAKVVAQERTELVPARAGDLVAFAYTDMGNADRVRSLYGDRMFYSGEEKAWLVWGEKHWQRQDGEAQELAKSTALEFTRQALGSGQKIAIRSALDFQNKSRISNALALLASALKVSTADFDRQAHLLNCRNGTVDLRTGQMHPHRREDRITKLVDTDYSPDAKCPQFLAFLARLMGHTPDASEGELALAAETLDYLELAFGYSITGETSEKAVFVAHGLEDTGKTTLLGLVRQLLSGYATTIKLEVILQNDRSNSAEAALANLRGARFAQSSETEDGQRISAALLKRVSQGPGGMIAACRKYENPITFPETHKLWIDANYRPELSAADSAAWRRLRLIPFTVQIPKTEQDGGLLDRLLDQESAGILAWLVTGARRWYASGLPSSRTVDSATEDWREAVNRVKVFLDEACLREVNASVPNRNLYGAYKAWCEENGERALSNRKFSEQMKSLGFDSKHTNSGTDWLGLRFRLPA